MCVGEGIFSYTHSRDRNNDICPVDLKQSPSVFYIRTRPFFFLLPRYTYARTSACIHIISLLLLLYTQHTRRRRRPSSCRHQSLGPQASYAGQPGFDG